MSLRNRNPREPRSAERDKPEVQLRWLGMLKDMPFAEIPAGYCYRLINAIARALHLEAAPGTRLYKSPTYPSSGNINAHCDHDKSGYIIWQIHNKVYVSDKTITTFTEVFNQNGYTLSPSNVQSTIVVEGDNAILVNPAGIWRINLTRLCMYRINTTSIVADEAGYYITDIAESETLIYGYRYVYTSLILSGTGDRNRTTEGVSIEYESPAMIISGRERDHGEKFFATAIGVVVTETHTVAYLNSSNQIAATHMGLYRTRNIGSASGGYNPDTKSGNNPEQYIWVADIPVAKAMEITVAADKTFVVNKGWLNRNDLYETFREATSTIDPGVVGYTDSTHGTASAFAGISKAFTADAATDVLTVTGGLWTATGHRVKVSSDGVLPAPLTVDTIYYAVLSGTLKLATTLANAIDGVTIDITDAGTGTHTMTDVEVSQYVSIGGNISYGSQTGNIITSLGAKYTADLAGKMIVWADGGYSIIKAINDQRVVMAAWSETHVAQPYAIASTNFRKPNDYALDDGSNAGEMGLEQRLMSGKALYLPNRFYREMSGGDIAFLDSGTLGVISRGTTILQYCDVAVKPYMAGYYRNDQQRMYLQKGVNHIEAGDGTAVIVHKNGLQGLNLTVRQDVGDKNINEYIIKLPEAYSIDSKVGVVHWNSIASLGMGAFLAVTSEPAVRIFDGKSWGERDYAYTAEGYAAVVSEIKNISATYGCIASYTRLGGYKLWIYSSASAIRICLRLAVFPAQGYGWSERGGTGWVIPKQKTGVITILDANSVERNLVLDLDGKVYEDGTYDADTYTGETEIDKDDAGTGVEIPVQVWQKKFVADVANKEMKIKHEESHVFIEPKSAANISATGYDAYGMRTAQEFTLEAYEDNAIAFRDAITEDFPINGDLVFSGQRVEARGLMYVFKTLAGALRITGIKHVHLVLPKAGSRSERTMDEHTLQRELALNKVMHLSRKNFLYDLVSQDTLAGSVVTATGPEGRSGSAATLAADLNVGNAAIATNYTVMYWLKTGSVVAGTAQYGATFDSWKLYYAKGAGGIAASIVIPLGIKADFRLYSAQISDSAIAYYYNNVRYNEGKGVLPGF